MSLKVLPDPAAAANRNMQIRAISGRAFAVEAFGFIPQGTVNDVIMQLAPHALAGDGAASYAIFLNSMSAATLPGLSREGSCPATRRPQPSAMNSPHAMR